jgi:predicted kinase
MSARTGTLHLLCGKIAAGKSTLAARLSAEHCSPIVGEDYWLSRLYGAEMASVDDYVLYSARLREAMGPHLADLLRAGLSIVLDFPANTRASRAWMRGIAESAGAEALLHHLDVPDEICMARMHARNASRSHEFAPTDAQFDRITAAFEPPSETEGLRIARHEG